MTKPSEDFDKWFFEMEIGEKPEIFLNANHYKHIAWLAYLKGRDERPVVVPIKKEVSQLSLKRKSFEWVCPECGSYKLHEHCGSCGALLDWSKAKEYKNE